MKATAIRRALLLANIFNLLVALYFIVIAIVALVQLRWYHQLTITVKVRYLLTSVTSYFAFFILIFAALLLIAMSVTSTLRLSPRTYISPSGEDAINLDQTTTESVNNAQNGTETNTNTTAKKRSDMAGARLSPLVDNKRRIVFGDSISADDTTTNTSACCSILIHLLAATCLVVILIIWLFNTGELVRDSISTQLDAAFAKYQFSNRSNYYTIAIDGMQDINNCCGSLDYTDFPHQRISGLSSGHYPGSCCGKNIFGVNARVLCTPEEIWRTKQTSGCTTVLANYYDLISLLVVPVALVSLFVNITIIALITILKGNYHSLGHDELSPSETGHLAAARCARMKRTANTRNNPVQPAAKFELKSVA